MEWVEFQRRDGSRLSYFPVSQWTTRAETLFEPLSSGLKERNEMIGEMGGLGVGLMGAEGQLQAACYGDGER